MAQEKMEYQVLIPVRLKLLLLGVLSIWVVLLEQTLPLALLAGCSWIALLCSGAELRQLLYAMGGLFLLLWGMALMQSIFYVQAPRTVWFALGTLSIYREGFWYGLTQGLRVMATVGAGLALVFSTRPDRLMQGLRAFGVPSGLSFLLMTGLRFLPLFAHEARSAWVALRMRGFTFQLQAPFESMKLLFSLLRPLLSTCVRRANTLATALELRGFRPGLSIGDSLLPWSTLEVVMVAFVTILTLALMLAKVLYALYQHELYYEPALRPWYAFVQQRL